MDKKTVEIRATVNAEVWAQFCGLAKFLKMDKNELLNEVMKKRITLRKVDIEKLRGALS